MHFRVLCRFAKLDRSCTCGRVFTTPDVSLNIPESVLFTDYVKRLKTDRCFHEQDYYISLW